MTATDLAQDPARLNALVEVHVFGRECWREQRGNYTYVYFSDKDRKPWTLYRDAEDARARFSPLSIADIDPHKHIVLGVHDYSTDISAAWEVVEKIGGATIMTPGAYTDEGRGPVTEYSCALLGKSRGPREPSKGPFPYAIADTLPIAICLAALKAVGWEERK
jgi:hypothetical protein